MEECAKKRGSTRILNAFVQTLGLKGGFVTVSEESRASFFFCLRMGSWTLLQTILMAFVIGNYFILLIAIKLL